MNLPKQHMNYSRAITILILVWAVAFLMMNAFGKRWEGEAKYIVSPKSELVATHVDTVSENLVQVVYTQKFLDLVFAGREDEHMAHTLDAQRIGESSVIRMTYVDKDLDTVKSVLLSARKSLYKSVQDQYDVRKDLSLKAFDSFTARKVSADPVILLFISLGIGILVALMVEAALSGAFKTHQSFRYGQSVQNTLLHEKWWESYRVSASSKKEHLSHGDEVESVVAPIFESQDESEKIVDKEVIDKKSVDQNSAILEEENEVGLDVDNPVKGLLTRKSRPEKKIEQEAPPSIPKMSHPSIPSNLPIVTSPPVQKKPVSGDKKGSAPSNLPIGGMSDLPVVTQDAPVSTSDESTELHTEPTEEELKARLNKLLRGDL